jgi:DNA polymerase-1
MSKLLLFDAYSLIYRAFYAIRELTGPDGQPVNAIYGFLRMTRKMIADQKPTHCAAVFDLGAPQYRLGLLPTYKEQRPPTPQALDAQVPVLREILDAMRLPIVEVAGEEADDIIGTLAVQAATAGSNVLIASSDKDFTQIINSQIQVIRPDGSICDARQVEERYGVRPDQMVDYLSLLGDSVDNIRGVPGVGEKTAAELLRQHGTIETLLAAAPTLPKPKLRESLMNAADQLRLNRALIALQCTLPLPVGWESLKVEPADSARLIPLLKKCGFKSLLAEIEKESQRADDLFAGI